jgi:hypothetical protein
MIAPKLQIYNDELVTSNNEIKMNKSDSKHLIYQLNIKYKGKNTSHLMDFTLHPEIIIGR